MATAGQRASTLVAPASRAAECPFDPPPAYDRLRREDPVSRVTLWDGSTPWLLTRLQDVRFVLRDNRFSADANREGFPFLSAGRKVLTTDRPTFIRMDDPEHAHLRRMLTSDFMIKKVETMRPEIQRLADELLDRMTEGRRQADLVKDFALPLPSIVICLLLGVPYEDHAFFQDRSSTMLNSAAAPEEISAAQEDLLAYLVKLTDARREAPDDGILSRLAARGDLTTEQIAVMGRLLLIAGHETTANMTSLSVLALLRNPEQLARLRGADLDEAYKPAVEELLRYLSVVQSGVARVATEDVEVGGVTIRAGEGVLCMLSTANRDEDAFPGADRLDVHRDARRHVAFGFGVHQCLGQPLARLELQIALATVLRRLPDLRLAVPFEQIPFRHEMLVYGVHELPVAW